MHRVVGSCTEGGRKQGASIPVTLSTQGKRHLLANYSQFFWSINNVYTRLTSARRKMPPFIIEYLYYRLSSPGTSTILCISGLSAKHAYDVHAKILVNF